MEMAATKNDLLTPSQRRAVDARGNVLVMAGAGTGKTKTLVERCLDCLEHDFSGDEKPPNVARLLVVTFTEAAAAELRLRLGKRLAEKVAAHPNEEYWQKEIAGIDLAHIGTLHSFCLQLVREHFYELGLDAQLAILDEGETRQCANETLDEQFKSHYEGADEFSRAVQNLIQIHGGGRDEKIRSLILRLHQYSQTRPDAAAWLAQQIQTFAATEPADWRRWLLTAIKSWCDEWLVTLAALTNNEKAAELTGILSLLGKEFSRESAAEILEQIISTDGNWPNKKKIILRQPLVDLFDEAAFLVTLAPVKNGRDPLAEDWRWVRGPMETLLRLAQEFAQKFSERKRDSSGLDFHDLEQFALKLLWDFSTDQPTAVARAWREKLKFVFVDEYQDINAAQDKIIAALSRDATPGPANRFLVGDVKQSIYRFRLADPKIFRDYARDWENTGEIIPLAENFRSREGLLNFVNSVCRLVLRAEIGGVAYDEAAELKFGLPQLRGDFSTAKDSGPRAELLLRRKSGRDEKRDEDDALADLDESQKEARLVAWRLKQFVAEQNEIWDDHAKCFRAAAWRDVAILLRSPRGKSEVYAQEFERAGIPLAVARGRFFGSAEILDLLSLLQLLDNPLQDVPCLAVLRSPLVGLSLDELAEIRLAAREKHFWTALVRSQNPESKIAPPASAKVSKFLERFSRWRTAAKQISLSQCLEEILAETLYADWLRAQPRGAQRAANLAGFLNLAQKFDQFQRQGLFRFLKFIEAQQDAEVEPDVPATVAENAVRLMSIHQSKGLEFPVVVLADLAKTFNEQDLRGEIIFDEEFGLCPKVQPPASGRRYPSLPHWLAQRRQKRELRGEELRLLYVALTRARDNLILTASLTEKNWEEKWAQPQAVTTQKIADARSFADWLALWFSNQSPNGKSAGRDAGELESLRWRLVADETWSENPAAEKPSPSLEPPGLDAAELEILRQRLEWNYAFTPATRRKAKSSVTTLRREAEEIDDEAEAFFPRTSLAAKNRSSEISSQKLTATEIGAAHHTFLQHIALEKTGALAAEAERLVRENYLTVAEKSVLDFQALAIFWNSELGEKIRTHAAKVRRELPFTARFSPAEIAKIIGGQPADGLEAEFIVVQGVADLVVLLPDEIWLMDFKTDAVGDDGLPEKIKTYAPQLQLYALALEKIFARKVTLRGLYFLSAGRLEIV